MRRRSKLYLLLCWLILCCALPAAAQVQTDSVFNEAANSTVANEDTDSAFGKAADSTIANEDVDVGENDPEPEEEPAREIVYNTSAPNAAQWEQTVSENAYGYRDKREYIKKPEPPPEVPGWYKFLVRFVDFLSSTTGQIILWSGLALIVGYVVYRIIAGQGGGIFGRSDRRESTADTGPISEEGLLEGNWEESLRTALAAGDTRLAIRYSYMHVLQVMQERGLIIYRPDKTNTEYYFTLTESLRPSFRTISRQYEYAWYGNFIPGAEALESYMQTYNSLKKSITYA